MSYQTSSKRSPPFWLLIGARKLLCFFCPIRSRKSRSPFRWTRVTWVTKSLGSGKKTDFHVAFCLTFLLFTPLPPPPANAVLSAFYPQSSFYPWSAVCSLQSAVCSLQSAVRSMRLTLTGSKLGLGQLLWKRTHFAIFFFIYFFYIDSIQWSPVLFDRFNH